MGTSSRTLHALVRAPGLVVATVLTFLVGALLPPLAGLALFVGGLAVMLALCAGRLEGPAVRLLWGAKALSATQTAGLEPALTLLCRQGLGPPATELYVDDDELGITAGAAGRRSVVVSAGLAQAAQLGHLPADQTAAVIAAAVGRIRLGQTRYDLAVQFWTIPWQLVLAVAAVTARAVRWLPLTGFAWRIRFVVAAVAVVQSVAAGRPASAVVVAVFIALTYLAPRWRRQWDLRSQDDTDRFVADHGLGEALARYLRRSLPGGRRPRTTTMTRTRTLERIHHLTAPALRPCLALVAADPAPGARG